MNKQTFTNGYDGYRIISKNGGAGFPCLAGITTNKAGDFRIRKIAEEKPEEEFKMNNLLARQLVGESHYYKIVTEHGIRIINIEKAGNWNSCDGLISYDNGFRQHLRRGGALFSPTADCPIVVFSSPGQELIGIIHCGWKEVYKGIISTAAEKIREHEIRMKNVLFGIFSGICADCYTVGEEFQQWFPKEYKNGHLNLRAAIKRQLLGEGACKGNIFTEEYCSMHTEEEGKFVFHSFRRDGTKERNLVFIARKL